MGKPSVLTVRVPSDLKHRIDVVAEEQGVSINQLALYMFSREVSSFEAGNKISKYWKGYDKKEIVNGFDVVMAKVKEREIPEWDMI